MSILNFERFSRSINESTSYSTLGNNVPFDDVVEFLKGYQDEANIALLGYNDKEENFHVIPLLKAKFDKKKNYVACLMTIDSAKWKKMNKDKTEAKKEMFKLMGHGNLNDMVDSIGRGKGNASLHDYVHIIFDDDGNLEAADRFGANDVEWFTDEFGMADEHSDEYQEFFNDGSEDDE